MKQKGFALVAVLAVVVVALVAGGVWYYYATRSPANPGIGPTSPITTTTALTPTPVTTTTMPDLFRAGNVSAANNQFAIDLYARYAGEKSPGENIFFSPFSISSAMAMVYEGAKGQTAQEIANVFHFPTDITQLRNGYQTAFTDINNYSASYTLHTANALWVEKDYQLLASYTNAIKTYYGGNAEDVDFVNAPSVAVSTINQWVANQTANKIQNILSPSSVDHSTKLVLTNAIYFKGAWSSTFGKGATQQKAFTTGSGSNSQVPMMEQTSNFNYADVGSAQVLQLPYYGQGVSMFIVLPKDNDLPAFEKSMTYQKVVGWQKAMNSRSVDVSLPKFNITTEEHMPTDLEAMGMPTAFSSTAADFSGIAPISDPSQNLYVSDVIHKAFIDTDENGTEAAAATAVVMATAAAMEPTPPPPVVFNANHPFIFFIQEMQTGNILFLGRVVSP